jgi:hypothetical protein
MNGRNTLQVGRNWVWQPDRLTGCPFEEAKIAVLFAGGAVDPKSLLHLDTERKGMSVVPNHMSCLQGLGRPLQESTLLKCAKIAVLRQCAGQ